MTTLLQDSAVWLGERLAAAAGRQVCYGRRSGCVEASGWPAAHEYTVNDDDGIPTRLVSVDWTFPRGELVLGGKPLEPRPGDMITETLDGEEFQYEVMPLGGRPCWEWLDTGGRILVVHTKRIS